MYCLKIDSLISATVNKETCSQETRDVLEVETWMVGNFAEKIPNIITKIVVY